MGAERLEMGQVMVTVNGRPYAIACGDGEEPRIRRLAQYVDARVGEFVKANGQAGEARLLLLAALVIADELSEANEALRREAARPRSEPGAATRPDAGSQAAMRGIEAATNRIEAIAARLESP